MKNKFEETSSLSNRESKEMLKFNNRQRRGVKESKKVKFKEINNDSQSARPGQASTESKAKSA
jgi:hypothetical protein